MELAFLIIAFFAFVGGGAALLVGMAGHRVGSEPVCRKCRYNLTDLKSPQCPECGIALTPKGILIGVHRRRPRAIFLGICTLIFGAACVVSLATGFVKRINLYRIVPARWLVSRAEASDGNALLELSRRVIAGSITTSEARMLAAAAIRNVPPVPSQPKRVFSPRLAMWLLVLEGLLQAGALPPDERDEYVARLYRVEAHVRPTLRRGDPCPVRITLRTRQTNPTTLTVEMSVSEVRVGEHLFPAGGVRNHVALGSGSGGSQLFNALPGSRLEPGTHVLELDVVQRLIGPSSILPTPNDWTRTLTISLPLEVIPADAPDPIRIVHDPSIDTAIRDAIRVDRIRWKTGDMDVPEIEVGADRPLPLDVSFDVSVLVGDRQICKGGLTFLKDGGNGANWDYSGSGYPIARGAIQLLLYGNRAAADRSPDVTEYWDGEIVLGPFELKPGIDASGSQLLEYSAP